MFKFYYEVLNDEISPTNKLYLNYFEYRID